MSLTIDCLKLAMEMVAVYFPELNAGIKKVYYEEGYDDLLSDQMLAEAGIEKVRLSL